MRFRAVRIIICPPMNTRCPVCNAPVDADPIQLGRTVRCERCGAKLAPPPAPGHAAPVIDDTDGLGIHPALLQRHRNRGGEGPSAEGASEGESGPKAPSGKAPPASVQLSPSLVSEVNEIDPETSMELPGRYWLPELL